MSGNSIYETVTLTPEAKRQLEELKNPVPPLKQQESPYVLENPNLNLRQQSEERKLLKKIRNAQTYENPHEILKQLNKQYEGTIYKPSVIAKNAARFRIQKELNPNNEDSLVRRIPTQKLKNALYEAERTGNWPDVDRIKKTGEAYTIEVKTKPLSIENQRGINQIKHQELSKRPLPLTPTQQFLHPLYKTRLLTQAVRAFQHGINLKSQGPQQGPRQQNPSSSFKKPVRQPGGGRRTMKKSHRRTKKRSTKSRNKKQLTKKK